MIRLLKAFNLLVGSKEETNDPSVPGAMGSAVQLIIVHPQDGLTFSRIKSESPSFTKTKVCLTSPSSSLIVPKSWMDLSNLIIGNASN